MTASTDDPDATLRIADNIGGCHRSIGHYPTGRSEADLAATRAIEARRGTDAAAGRSGPSSCGLPNHHGR